jgi:cell division inhibitor SepF
MASKIFKPFNKVMGAIGLVDIDPDEDIEEDIGEDEEEIQKNFYDSGIINRKNKIVSIKNNVSARVILNKPIEFQDIMEIVDNVKSRKIIVMNMTDVEPKIAQRMIDYIVGACYALNGSFEEIEKCIYIFAPDGVEVSNELRNQINGKNFYSFEG